MWLESEDNEIEDFDEGDVKVLFLIYFVFKIKGMLIEDVVNFLLGIFIDECVVIYRFLDVLNSRVYVFKIDCFVDI